MSILTMFNGITMTRSKTVAIVAIVGLLRTALELAASPRAYKGIILNRFCVRKFL